MDANSGAHRTGLGVDVGGANLKWGVALRDDEAGEGRVIASGTLPFPLWRDPDALPDRLDEVGRDAARALRRADDAAGAVAPHRPDGAPREAGSDSSVPDVVALSLTGELADCYADRPSGVRHIVGAARRVWSEPRPRVLCRDGAWRTASAVERAPRTAAAANWRGPAAWLARRERDVLLADMGSTTTDLVPVRSGEIASGARTDLDRLRAGELVYTGLLRTPVCAMVGEVELPDGPVPVAAERFAVAADVHLWLGSLAPEEYRCQPPDGGSVGREDAARRIARMVCAEPEELGRDGVDAVARAAADAQARAIVDAVGRQRRPHGTLPRKAIPTGAGADLVAAFLRRAGLELADPPPPLAGEHARASTATTLALLALEDAV